MSLHEKPSFYLSEALSLFLICFIFEVSKRELCVFENVEKEFFYSQPNLEFYTFEQRIDFQFQQKFRAWEKAL
ncbi:hypothetical protein CEV31_0010 [Brucella thiophenivorans]|uniref:Uncharacterized protein n=1 Tax=Brucella thiophenivorans TaxID=571255 RepID=A0A256G9I5_9HYPH|nr:hypothetical protein CEV31_0010 [Brucella thiophenivorans]